MNAVFFNKNYYSSLVCRPSSLELFGFLYSIVSKSLCCKNLD